MRIVPPTTRDVTFVTLLVLAFFAGCAQPSPNVKDRTQPNTAPSPSQSQETQIDELYDRIEKLRQTRRSAEAIPLAEQGLALTEGRVGKEHPDVAEALIYLAVLYGETSQPARASLVLQRVLSINEKTLGPEHPETASTLNMLAVQYQTMGEYAKAEPLLQRALNINEKALGPEHPETATTLSNIAVQYQAMGQYVKAEPLYLRALAINEKALGPEHRMTGVTLNNLALLYKDTGQYAKAEPLYQRTLLTTEKSLGPDHPDTALSLNNLGTLYHATAEYAKAEPLLQRALSITEKVLGPEHSLTATALNNLGALYRATGQYAKAKPLLQRALAIDEKVFGPEHSSTATDISNLGILYQATGQHEKAELLLQRALVIREKAFGPEHPVVATALTNLADFYRTTGQFSKAEPLLERALAIKEKDLGLEHPSLITTLHLLAGIRASLGSIEKALPPMLRALKIMESRIGPEHPKTVFERWTVSQAYRNTGNMKTADVLLEENLSILERAPESYDPRIVNMILMGALMRSESLRDYEKTKAVVLRMQENLEKVREPKIRKEGGLRLEMILWYTDLMRTGDVRNALLAAQRTLRSAEEQLGPDHPLFLESQFYVAFLSMATGDPFAADSLTKVESLLRRTLTNRERTLGSEHLDVAKSLGALAVIYQLQGDFAKTESSLSRAVKIVESNAVNIELSHYLPKFYNALGTTYRDIGDYEKAEAAYQKALTTSEGRMWGLAKFDILDGQASLEVRRGRYSEASRLFEQLLTVEDEQIRNVFHSTSEREKLSFLNAASSSLHSFLSLISTYLKTNQVAVRKGLDAVLRRKGVVLDAQTRLIEGIRAERLRPTEQETWLQLATLRRQLADLLLQEYSTSHVAPPLREIEALQQAIDALEQRLARESPLVEMELQQRGVTSEAVARKLPRGTVLLEFLKIQDIDHFRKLQDITNIGKKVAAFRYLAFILTPAGDVTLVDLGDAGVLEQQIGRVLKDLRVAQVGSNRPAITKSLESLKGLSANLWAPLQQVLGTADHLVVSPDGLLNLVPFAALPTGEGRVLLEDYHLSYVTSGRDLVRTDGRASPPTLNLLLVANPAFDAKTTSDKAPSVEASLRSRDFRGHFDPLPGTEREAREIPALVASPTRVMVGHEATEGVVKDIHSPRILHLATHGFFLEDQLADIEPMNVRGVSVTGSKELTSMGLEFPILGLPLPTRPYENPLVRAGLAFAGANGVGTVVSGDDGILTALEITGMDLSGTDLVVLSACETAVGTIQTGEGVFGLRRAFALAGAKNLLMSLWPVQDDITADQMKAFYQNLHTLPPADALRQAQLETIRTLKSQYGIASPARWAPFILQGASAFNR